MMKLLSVIIPCYNVAQYLADCLESVFSQDVDNSIYEVIVVDDYSPYGEKEIVDTYLEKYSNIRYIRHEVNKRQGGARNTGIRAARGEYVMFLDADDCILYSNTFSILKECVGKNKSVVLRSTALESFPSDRTYLQIKDVYNGEVSCESLDFVQWRMSSMFSCSSCATLYKRSFLQDNNLFFREGVLYEDSDWVQKTMYYAKHIHIIDFTYYGYRQSLNSTTRGHTIAAFEGNVEGVIETYKFYKDKIDWNDSFAVELKNGFVNSVVGLLKVSRNYSISISIRLLRKLNIAGITSLKCLDNKKNFIVRLVRYIPFLPIFVIKILVLLKRLKRSHG